MNDKSLKTTVLGPSKLRNTGQDEKLYTGLRHVAEKYWSAWSVSTRSQKNGEWQRTERSKLQEEGWEGVGCLWVNIDVTC